MSKVDWEAILALNNIDAVIEQFESQFTLLLDQHAPVKQRKVRNKYAPYISSELRQQMFRRDTIKKRFRRTKDLKDWEKFVQLRNKVNTDKTKAKKSYYNQSFKTPKMTSRRSGAPSILHSEEIPKQQASSNLKLIKLRSLNLKPFVKS